MRARISSSILRVGKKWVVILALGRHNVPNTPKWLILAKVVKKIGLTKREKVKKKEDNIIIIEDEPSGWVVVKVF